MKLIKLPAPLDKIEVINLGSPDLVTGTSISLDASQPEQGWHVHESGYLGGIRSGLLGIRTHNESIVLSSGMMIYIPAGVARYQKIMSKNVLGWMINLPIGRVPFLGPDAKVLQVSKFMDSLCERIVKVGCIEKEHKTPRQLRIIEIFLDELVEAKTSNHLNLPLPSHSGLRLVVESIMDQLNDKETIDHWSRIAGMSRRSFTDYFLKETGLTFSSWRQRLKLQMALRLLSEGKRVNEISEELGFSTNSAFIEVFRKQFGTSPGQYMINERQLLSDGQKKEI